ncbi:hypothetical protein FisN_16Hu236 [Fistulifera solaris]|uniref:SnoaL-like domain-containing protein n=1 Tax=Fistulifera solaris TaxID=1519565 RepID=A0A1Z5KSN0_FISSO|nr:hypothetical protein FisN_16Hu236 [Fistulifera solaris]|eukprot:GAX29330.1 hypothetical protein FisN_16Hu236 [Fistulifera solaris]
MFKRIAAYSSFLLTALFSTPVRSLSASSPMISTELALAMEATVRRYFQGVTEKDSEMIRSCFGESATIRDVCALQSSRRTVPATQLVDRCMQFVTAHPDCVVQFHYGPECSRQSNWVFAHWYETGTWSGTSCDIEPNHQPMAVEGQTRFKVCSDTLKIQELVVTRTFTEWERMLLEKPQ